MDYTIVIGLEVHVQLLTESKMFSSCGTEFGLPPNTQTDPVSLGLPGTLPVMNGKAFELALKTAVALAPRSRGSPSGTARITTIPTCPRITRSASTTCRSVPAAGSKSRQDKDGKGGGRCRLVRVHLEEDTGKLTHGAGGISEVDLNRAGIPLMEIVTEPDMRTPEDAKACLEELRLTLRYLGVSDCEMQEGSLRCDANVNLHIEKDGKTIATPIAEIKNLNSFRAVERALYHEAERQYAKWKADGLTIKDAPKTTRGWSDPEGVTKPQREKETAADYRYFPEPDLVPVVVDEAWLERIRASIGELPSERRQRFETEYGLPAYDANVLVEQGQDVADYFDSVAKATGEYKLASNWIQQDVLRTAKEKKIRLAEFPVRPEALADLINRVKNRKLNTNQGREVLAKMIETGEPLDTIIKEGGYGMVADRDALTQAIEAALAANPKAVEDLKGGKKKPEAVKGFLRGQVMKQTGGKADPKLVGELLEAKLAALESGSGDG